MARIKFPLNGEMRGSVGGTTYSRSASGFQTVRARVTPTNPKTAAQRNARLSLGAASTSFATLSTSAKNMWNAFAASVGSKFGRWEYVKRAGTLASVNRYLCQSASGIVAALQVPLDPIALLGTPSALAPDFLITSGTSVGGAYTITPLTFSVGANSMSFDVTLADTTKNFLEFLNSAGRKMAVKFVISVQKKQSKYLRDFLAFSDLKLATAASVMHVTAAISPVVTTDYKYAIAVGSVINIKTYVYDPGSNMQAQLVNETTLTAGA